MKKGILVTLLLWAQLGFGQAAQFRGASQIEDVLSERLLDGKPFSFYPYFGATGISAYMLRKLLGVYDGAGGEATYQNGHPNSVNLLLYNMVLNGFAQELAGNCIKKTFPLTPTFFNTLQKMCGWPNQESQSLETMRTFWISLMGYDAPEEEFVAWRDFLLSSSYKTKTAQETMPSLILAILYNPHFLLEK